MTLDIGPIAHGGSCVARHEGRVVFVRHTLPGERVVARITEGRADAAYLRADAIEVLSAAPGRVDSRCPVSGPGGCGGCDFQHVDLATQLELLGAVVSEQLRRLGGVERDVVVEPADAGDGLGWRTRVSFSVGADDRLGLFRHRSHDVVPVERCPIAHPDLADVSALPWPAERVEAVVSSEGDRLVAVDGLRADPPRFPAAALVDARGRRLRGRGYVRERVRDRDFRVSGAGFWQVHPAAASTLVDAVLAMAEPRRGETAADLYAGVGLFSAFLAEAVGSTGAVCAVESSAAAVRDSRRNLHDLPQVQLVHATVERALRQGAVPAHTDLVMLDPPRTGARSRVVDAICAREPARVCYVACDPAALGRDVAQFARRGYELTDLRAFALFPMTHHVECVALLTKPAPDLG